MTKKVLESFHTVASYELDSFGHVNNAVFLNYLEKARCDFMTLRGLKLQDFFEWHRYPVVRKARLEYKRPALAGEKLHIKGHISHYTHTSFTLQYQITNHDTGHLVLTGETSHVFVDDNNRPSRIPPLFYERFIAIQGSDEVGDNPQ